MRFSILIVLICSAALFAELPPSAYEALQAKAPESLSIQVLQVRSQAGKEPGQTQITVMALVDKVNRSTSLKPNDIVTIVYTITPHADTGSAPREVPVLKEGDTCVAYLAPIENSPNFHPAAGAMSFRNF